MILNVSTVAQLFLSGVGILLSGGTLAILVWVAKSARGPREPRTEDVVQERVHLLMLVVVVTLIVFLLAYAHFYWMLRSYVPELATFGVMCAFGVTRIQPTLVLGYQIAMPMVMLGLGLACVLAYIDRREGSLVTLPIMLWTMRCTAILGLGACVVNVFYIFAEKAGTPVTCCTQFLDTDAANFVPIDSEVLARSASGSLRSMVFGVMTNGCIILAAVFGRFRYSRGGASVGRPFAVLLALAAVGNLIVTRAAWLDHVAPRVLGLPYHHCIYELITDYPMMAFAAALSLTGNLCLWWLVVLRFVDPSAGRSLTQVRSAICGFSAVAVLSSAVIVGVHSV